MNEVHQMSDLTEFEPQWEWWFAWHPVWIAPTCWTGRWYWLRWVRRRERRIGHEFRHWEYELC